MSNIIKSSHYVPVEQMRMLEAIRRERERLSEQEQLEYEAAMTAERLLEQDKELEELRRSILLDAQSFAEDQVRASSDEAERMLEEARQQIEAWWNERREEDEQLRENVQQEAYNQGYHEGISQAEQEIQIAYEEKIGEGAAVLQQAYQAKEQIIQEAEPFVVAVSTAVAEKIIDRQLSLEPELIIELARKQLSRKRESGRITLCVSPEDFNFVHAAREELSIAIDSQAELLIIPDASVKDHGCVIRSSLGSIDARINTQLEELKKALQQIAMQQEEQSDHES
ncbi:FliH/SctL family protein [Paenibacillus marinisediminis]